MIEIDDSRLFDCADKLGGLPVLACMPGASAAGAGVKTGDILVQVNGLKVTGIADYARARAKDPDVMLVSLLRDGKPLELTIPLSSSELPTVNARSTPGMS